MADEGLLGGKAEPAGRGAGSDDEGAGVDDGLAEVKLEGRLAEIDGGEMGHAEFGAKADGLLLHVLDELGTLDALGPAGKVFDQRGDGELAAGLVAFENEGLEVGARCVNGGGETCAARAENDGVAYFDGFGHNSLIVAGWKGFKGRD